MSFVVFVIFLLSSQCVLTGGFYTNLLRHGRLNRHCHESSAAKSLLPVEDGGKFTIFLVFLSGLLFFLIFLGMLKGLIGVYCISKVGTYGLNLLIELPRPLARYQEKDLERRSVVYDIGGWPVHPDTLERTVRTLPKRTEFCLNLIFFLAYPLAACVYICAFCCCIKNLTKSNEDNCFRHVDVVRLTQDDKNNNRLDGAVINKEEQDTKYVINAMKKSQESIHEFRSRGDQCPCH